MAVKQGLAELGGKKKNQNERGGGEGFLIKR